MSGDFGAFSGVTGAEVTSNLHPKASDERVCLMFAEGCRDACFWSVSQTPVDVISTRYLSYDFDWPKRIGSSTAANRKSELRTAEAKATVDRY